MATQILNKPILRTTISDYAKIMNEVAKKNKNVALDFMEDGIRSDINTKAIREMDPKFEVFTKNGRFTPKAQANIINSLKSYGYKSNANFKDITAKDFINMLLNKINKNTLDIDYYA
ncbi:MAG: hypothetical protein E7Z87_07950 [Cyanobacteria bacterium SIG26]|nr:hypothetical protein [Cyanobacteria bacterium SIG26]